MHERTRPNKQVMNHDTNSSRTQYNQTTPTSRSAFRLPTSAFSDTIVCRYSKSPVLKNKRLCMYVVIVYRGYRRRRCCFSFSILPLLLSSPLGRLRVGKRCRFLGQISDPVTVLRAAGRRWLQRCLLRFRLLSLCLPRASPCCRRCPLGGHNNALLMLLLHGGVRGLFSLHLHTSPLRPRRGAGIPHSLAFNKEWRHFSSRTRCCRRWLTLALCTAAIGLRCRPRRRAPPVHLQG